MEEIKISQANFKKAYEANKEKYISSFLMLGYKFHQIQISKYFFPEGQIQGQSKDIQVMKCQIAPT